MIAIALLTVLGAIVLTCAPPLVAGLITRWVVSRVAKN